MIPLWSPHQQAALLERLLGNVPTGLAGEMADAIRKCGYQPQSVSLSVGDLPSFLRSGGPALLEDAEGRWLGILSGGLAVIPEGGERKLTVEEVEDWLLGAYALRIREGLQRVTARLSLPPSVHRNLYRQRTATFLLPVRCFLLRPAPDSLLSRARELQLPVDVRRLVFLLPMVQLVSVASWTVLGKGLLNGIVSPALFVVWLLLSLSALPLQWAVDWVQGRLALRAGLLLKERLLLGALRTEPDVIRSEGAGALIARVDESQTVETMVLQAAFSFATGGVGLVGAALILGWSAGLVALGLGLLISLLLLLRYAQHYRQWTQDRMDLTADILANMVGYRTRLAQLSPALWHTEEDRGLARYTLSSQRLDELTLQTSVFFPGAWRIFALLSLIPLLLGEAEPGAIALSLGGLLYGHSALLQLSNGFLAAISAHVAWKAVGALVQEGGRREAIGLLLTPSSGVVEIKGLSFSYPGREPILKELDLRLEPGAKVLLEGASGAGKSTFAAILAGIRSPTRGLLLLGGLDPRSLGPSAWRKKVVLTPQFHENHLFCEPLAFNLLMGRDWPPFPDQLAEAEAICRELGLGPLLERMPGGMMQMVGERGWKLSHGEQSRVMLARALLQGASVVVLDESFAALDPETMEKCLEVVFARAPTLVVIAHP